MKRSIAWMRRWEKQLRSSPRWRLGPTLALAVVFACTTAVPAPVPEVKPIPVASSPTAPGSTRATPPGTTAGGTLAPVVAGGAEHRPGDVGSATIRVLIGSSASAPRIASPGGMMLTTREGLTVGRASRNDVWTLERFGRQVRAVRPDGVPSTWIDGGIYARPVGGALLSFGGKPYRGDLAFFAGDTGVLIVNVVRIDDYLRGVIPLEIGTRSAGDSAAVQAQAVTARSYAYTRLTSDPNRVYDITGGVLDQVYGGVEVETPVASEAVESTRTLVLKYAGRVVDAPYHSTCGGSTAAQSEIWRQRDSPYLQSVSDQIPGTNRFFCDAAPRFRWTKTIEGSALNAALARYLASYTRVPNGTPGVARDVGIGGRTPSGRVSTVTISTDRGNFVVRGNDIRFVLRSPGGEILNSTYFSVETSAAADGSLSRIVLRGMGYGHGVGMCQSGAIGRARAGQDFRTILRTYYPGTSVGSAD